MIVAHRLSSLPTVPTSHTTRQPMIAPLPRPTTRFARHKLAIAADCLDYRCLVCVVHVRVPIFVDPEILVSLARCGTHRAASM
jgi:hypothetical protein